MKSFGMDIEITRGESFSIDFDVADKSKRPYIVLRTIQNPYIQISVVSNSFNSPRRYIKKWWLDLANGYTDGASGLEPVVIQRFLSVDPVEVSSTSEVTSEDYVYHCTADNKYYYLSTITGDVEEYNFRIVKSFTSQDTIKWVDMNYTYSIKLVGGQTVVAYLQGIVTENDLLPDGMEMPETVAELLELFDAEHKYLLKDAVLDGSPIQSYDIMQDILESARITVNTDDSMGR